jgi:hypothetical protein
MHYIMEFMCDFCKEKSKTHAGWMCYFLEPDICKLQDPRAKQFICTCSPTEIAERDRIDRFEPLSDSHIYMGRPTTRRAPRSTTMHAAAALTSNHVIVDLDALRMVIREELARAKIEEHQMEAVD